MFAGVAAADHWAPNRRRAIANDCVPDGEHREEAVDIEDSPLLLSILTVFVSHLSGPGAGQGDGDAMVIYAASAVIMS
jgi:hypothetical protein